MRIVITGATGFIGSYLAALFLREGAEVLPCPVRIPLILRRFRFTKTCTSFPGPWIGPETVFHRLVLQTHFSILPGAV